MPYVDPQTISNPTAGAIAPAAWGDAVRDAVEYLARNKPRCRVFNSAAITLTTATVTALTFNSERYDVGGCHSTVSNTSRLTVPAGEGGLYHIGGCAEFVASATGERIVDIRLNGATFITRHRDIASSGSTSHTYNVSTDYQLVAGDFVELTAFQNSGGNLNVSSLGNYTPEFWMRWVAL